MEQFEASNHNMTSQNIQIAAYPTLPPGGGQQPKSRCAHCCYHRGSYTSYPCVTPTTPRHPPSCTCHGPGCAQSTCYPTLQQTPPPTTACACASPVRCSTPVLFHPHPSSSHPPHPPPHPHETGGGGGGGGGGCACCRRQQQQPPPPPPQPQSVGGHHHLDHHHHHHHHQISRIHLTTENVTYPTPHYATAYASLPGLHHSWEPTTGYQEAEYNIHMGGSGSSIPEYHSHVHHHINQHINNENECSERAHSYREPPSWQAYTSRHYRRHSSRHTTHPYPSIIHYPVGYHYPLSRSLIPASYLFPPRHLIPASFEVIGELDTEPLTEEDWQEMEARSNEPKGLTKYEIEKLPSYFVTKNTMKDFTEDERCVICMCEFDVGNSLRILPCAHEFHCECVDKWLETNPTCPICRATIDVT